MESNAWLVLVTAGLSLDICGIIILAGPLLKFRFNYYKDLKKRISILKEQYGEAVIARQTPDKFTLSSKFVLMELSRIEKNTFEVFGWYAADELIAFKNGIIGLIIIISGFLLQIIGNAMK